MAARFRTARLRFLLALDCFPAIGFSKEKTRLINQPEVISFKKFA